MHGKSNVKQVLFETALQTALQTQRVQHVTFKNTGKVQIHLKYAMSQTGMLIKIASKLHQHKSNDNVFFLYAYLESMPLRLFH